ncbi:NAD(P)-binding protein [Mycena amicta]|nr:NAD(P)-binding protein [Mycena amicta]
MISKGVALVTGAGQGIGKAIALRLAKDGFNVGVNDIQANSQKLDALVEEIKAKGRAASAHIADVSNESQVQAMISDVVQVHKGLDVMVANAGVCKIIKLVDTSLKDWNFIMDVNVTGVFLCLKYAGLHMIAQGRGGRIIAASSLAGKQGSSTTTAYSTSKFAVRGLVQSAANEFGPHGITVNAYAPGAIETDMLNEMDVSSAGSLKPTITAASATKSIGLVYLAPPDHWSVDFRRTPEDIAGLVSYIASKESSFITGQSVRGRLFAFASTNNRPFPRNICTSTEIINGTIAHENGSLALPTMASKGVALVTGAGQGIGKAIALRLADDGFDVGVNDIQANSQKLDALVEEIKAKGRAASAHIADVSIESQVQAMVSEVVQVHKGLDVMVANAGVCKFAKVVDTSVDDWNRLMDVNARGTFLCFKYAGVQMVAQGRGGRIIAASSVAGKQGLQQHTVRPSSPSVGSFKLLVREILTNSSHPRRPQLPANEFGPHGITVNAYAPGAIETDMLDYLDDSSSGLLKNSMKAASSLKTTGTTADIAGLVSYIASEESRFITGQSVRRRRFAFALLLMLAVDFHKR